MSAQSERVKKWRRSCKERMIAAMGGKCCICSYNKCQSALAFHHLDPSKKDFNFSSIRANPKNWVDIVNELRKCILVCHVCHCEIHENLINVPLDAPSFNDDYLNYNLLTEDNLSPCKMCGKLKRNNLINCSYECARRSKFKVNWDKIDLRKELELKSIVELSKDLGCSDMTIRKRLRVK